MRPNRLLLMFVLAVALVATAVVPCAALPRLAPDFTWTDTGKTIHLKDQRGHLVVVNFFATWCIPCREEARALISVADQYASRGVRFVGVDSGEESLKLVSAYANLYNIDYQLVVDSTLSIKNGYGVNAFPTTFIVDRNGSVVAAVAGSLTAPDLVRLLNKYLPAH